MIQPEKAFYAPGQEIRFRVYVIDSQTNAITPRDKCIIQARDSNGNVIQDFPNPKFVKGKFEGKFVLGERAPTGNWAIDVTCGSVVSTIKIQLKKL